MGVYDKDVQWFAGSRTRPFVQHHLNEPSKLLRASQIRIVFNILKAAPELFSILNHCQDGLLLLPEYRSREPFTVDRRRKL